MLVRQSLPVATRAVALLRPTAASTHAVRAYADDHGSKKPTMHKEEWLEVARNWPHEYYYPGNYKAGSSDEIFPPTDNCGHDQANPSGAETVAERETFFSPFFLRFALLVGTATALYKVNESYAAGKDVHPFTAWLAKREALFTAEDAHKNHAKWIAIKQREADDRLIITDEYDAKRPYRISFPGTFQRASDHLVDPGSQIDVSDIAIKHTWQKNDDVAGVPYPNKN
ncbi:hypothetical protein HDU88_002397 [Geranomyces variabilis]|nr:hypothetical protein BDZ88DRAFT_468920 [Geranomyces variabilis]KAJ3132097.1 hypothetical protein HDU90_007530 [Geranomyces variabilis]KAJ3167060.1 hypothetical protein HDU88_002397 [Geranomyces variabilis]